MKKPPENIPNSSAFASFMSGVTKTFGVADASTQQSVDEALRDLLESRGVVATVLPIKWGKIVIEAPDAPAAQSVRYLMTQIEEVLQEKSVDATVSVRVAR